MTAPRSLSFRAFEAFFEDGEASAPHAFGASAGSGAHLQLGQGAALLPDPHGNSYEGLAIGPDEVDARAAAVGVIVVADVAGAAETANPVESVRWMADIGDAVPAPSSGGDGAQAAPVEAEGLTITVDSIAELRAALENPAYSTILVAPGEYLVSDHDPNTTWGEAGFYVSRDVTIKSAGPGRADFRAGFDIAKGIFVTGDGASVTFDGIGFFDTHVNFGSQAGNANYAGIRFQGGAQDALTVVNCHFENNFNAIKSNTFSGTLFVDTSTFEGNGNLNGSGQEHQIYWEGVSVHIEDSVFNDSGYGHSIKTVVSEFTRILRNTITDGDIGAPPIDITGGGDVFILQNVINKISQLSNGLVINYSTIRQGGDSGEILIDGNTFTSTNNYYGYPTTILLNNLSSSLARVTNNTISGNFEAELLRGDVVFTGNTIGGIATGDIGWRANADRLTDGIDTLFLTGSTGNFSGGRLQATDSGFSNDVLVASAAYNGTDIFFGGSGHDRLAGRDGDDYLYGGFGNDVLFAGAAVPGSYAYDRLFGGENNDFLTVGPIDAGEIALVWMLGGTGNDVLDARAATGYTLDGGEGNDVLLGATAVNDNWNGINGGAGHDIVFAGYGYNNYLYGGTGTDTLVYTGAYGTDLQVGDYYGTIEITGLTQAGTNEVSVYGERVSQFEYIQFSNGVLNATTGVFTAGQVRVSLASLLAIALPDFPGTHASLTLTGTAAANTLTGGSGDDIVTGLGGDDTLNGNGGYDLFRFTSASNGFDAVDGGTGYDTIAATANNVVIGLRSIVNVETIWSGGFAGVVIAGSNAADTLNFTTVALNGIASIQGGGGSDTLIGNAAANVIYGGTWNDIVNGGAGNDRLHGDDGNDLIYAGAGNDALYGGAGVDTLSYVTYGGGVTVDLSRTTAQTVAADDIDTIAFFENLVGGAGNDRLTGDAGVNGINGGAGNDIIDSGSGNDVLNGGAGADQFRRAAGATGIDRIQDFTSGLDKFALQDSGWNQTASLALRQGAGDQAANSANSTFLYNSTTGALSFDVDGTGAAAAVQIATLNAGLTLALGDFLFY